jgi:hypothetical protein
MTDEKLEHVTERLTVADISSAIAFGLQRAIDARGSEAIRDKILIYGGRLDFSIQVLPQGVSGVVKDTANIGQG